MNNFKIASVLAAALVSFGAQAAVVTIDDFSSPDVSIAGSGNSTDAVRTVNVVATASTSSLDIGSATGNGSSLEVSNRVGKDSTVAVSWSLAAGLLPTNATNVGFYFKVVSSDGNPTSLDFSFNNAALASFSIPGNTNDQELTFSVTSAQVASLSAGGSLGLVINGAAGWDMAIDTVGFQYTAATPTNVPEPGALALVGLALAGLALSRRRKA